MAANYIDRLRKVQPSGPYLLAGLCAGGVIAFEMARQLQNQGDLVAFVGIIDAADVAAAKRPFYITRSRLKRVSALVNQRGTPGRWLALVRKASNTVRWEIASRISRARDRRTVRQIRIANSAGRQASPQPEPDTAISFLKLYEAAHRLHRPEGLFEGGNVALFKATGGNGQADDIPYQMIYGDFALGWGRRVAEDVTVVAVPGGHSSVLQDPHVGTLARLLQDVIDGAMGRGDWRDVAEGESAQNRPMAVAAE
jgi:thioesterase domain-containing protein